jgi:hypothetical protein
MNRLKEHNLVSIKIGFEVLTAVITKMDVFWVVAPCSLAKVYQRFRGPCYLHHQGDRPDDGGIQFCHHWTLS